MVAAYHITHVANLDSMSRSGEIKCDRECANLTAAPTSIAYSDLKERRAETRVTVGPGGTLADYVPFYYAPRSPMLYVNYRGGVRENSSGQGEIVHLVFDVDELLGEGSYVITDGHAATPLTTQFDSADGLEEIDWDIMTKRQWADTDKDGDRKRRRQAELLVHERVPFSAVRQIGAIDDQVAQQARAALTSIGDPPPVHIRADWYY